MSEKLKAGKLRDMTKDELVTRLEAMRDELYHLRYKMHVEEVENPCVKREKKKNIARVRTILRERELAQATADTAAGAEPRGKER